MRTFLASIMRGGALDCPPRRRRTPRPTIPTGRSRSSSACRPAAASIPSRASSPNGLQQKLGQPVVVENRAGAAGNIGAEAVFTSDPDGYTLLAAQPSPLTVNPLLYKKMSVRSDQVRAGGDHDHDRQCAAGAAGFPGQDREGIHRLCQGQSGQGQLCLARHRHHLASDRGAVREGDRHQAGARALQGHRAGAQRPHRRPRRYDLHGARFGDQTAPRPARRAFWRWRRQSAFPTCPTSRRSTKPA